jgi:aryl-alcohol dehydrogenase-like predicted oxidoreductase
VAPGEGTRLAFWFDPKEQREALSDAVFDRVEALERFASERGRTVLELAFGWLLAQGPVASVIAGATTIEQVIANVGAASWQLDAQTLAAVPV